MAAATSTGQRGVATRLFVSAARPFQEFARTGALGGVVLLVLTAVALAWANSPWRDAYFHLWEARFTVGFAFAPLTENIHHWINDGLMAVFFLLAGLEIKRELLVGELSSLRSATLPIAAAAGGMLVPALLYVLVNRGGVGAGGWGIPMATDIAFALGVLTMLGPRVPVGLKVFLTALAIVDDMGAVLVIAFFYTSSIAWGALGLAALAFGVLLVLNRLKVRALTPYLLVGAALWAALLSSGIHATIAGVLLALAIPSRTRTNAAEFSARARDILDEFDRAETGDLQVMTSRGQQEAVDALEVAAAGVQAPLLRLEHRLHGIVAFVIMPLFALANAGVQVSGAGALLGSAVSLGTVLGLVIGKPLGILLFSAIAVRMGVARLPTGVTPRLLHGAAWLGGIGFTMSLFVAGLAFPDTPSLHDEAKVGVLVASHRRRARGLDACAT